MKKKIPLLFIGLFCFFRVNAQIEVAHASTKDYSATGFGGFLNFSFPIQDVNYITFDAGVEYFKDRNTRELDLFPLLLGYRYTLDQSGSGWYVEPNAGYSFAIGDIEDPEGASAGIGVGYLIDLGNIPFTFSARYEHVFGNPAANVYSIRIAHSFGFSKRDDD